MSNSVVTLDDVIMMYHLREKIAESNLEDLVIKDSDEINYMMSQAMLFPDKIMVFPSVKHHENVTYVEIYFVTVRNDGKIGYYQICFEAGKRLPIEDERALLYFTSNADYLMVGNQEFYFFVNAIREYFPDMKFGTYDETEIAAAILNVYFASHHSVLEILYKAGLNRIAEWIDNIFDVNYIGTSPSEIIGLPFKLLTIINDDNLVSLLYEEEGKKETLEVYERFSGYFEEENPSSTQWKYLVKITEKGEKFNRTVYRRLKDCCNERHVDEYRKFLKMRDVCNEYYPLKKIPDCCCIADVNRRLDMVKKLMSMEEEINKRFVDVSGKLQKYTSFGDDTYQVVAPKCLKDMTREAASQNNCLLNYIETINFGSKKEDSMVILFVRKKEKPEKSLITIELRGEYLIQALGPNNRDLNSKEKAFVEEFKTAFSLKDEED